MGAKEIAKKFDINLEKLKREQDKLSKMLKIKDSIDFSTIDKIAAIDNAFFKNQIISGCVLVSPDMEILEQEYALEKSTFPYIPGFRTYRELPCMVKAFNNLQTPPDIVLIPGHGIAHIRLGLASHFSLSTKIPSIGIGKSLLQGEVKGQDIFLNNKKVGKVLITKKGSRPLYVSPGDLISINTAHKVCKGLIKPPHKLPEPLHIAHKYSKEIRKEMFGKPQQ
jgi:deoxyribonuclease V